MEIGLSSACFYPEVLTEDSIKIMKKSGFEYGELFLNSPSEYDLDFIKKLVDEKEKNNFKVNSVHAFSSSFEPFLFDRYDRRRNDMLEHFKNVCRAGVMLGADSYTFHGLRLNQDSCINNKFILDIYNKLTYIALEIGIKLSQENVSWCMSGNLDFLKMLKEQCKNPLFYTFDIKQAHKAGVEWDKYLDVMGENLCNFHINDFNPENICMLPGKGEFDYEKISCKLRQIMYNGRGIIEVYRENFINLKELEFSREFLKKIL